MVAVNRVGAGNLCYVLYEMEEGCRDRIIANVVEAMAPPGLLLVTEPCGELTRQGCIVRLHAKGAETLDICRVSDGHFKGEVVPLRDYDRFFAGHPMALG